MGGYILLYSLLAGTAEVLLQATMGGYILLYSLLAGTAEVLPLIFRVSNGRHAWLLAGRLAGRLFFFFSQGLEEVGAARGSVRPSRALCQLPGHHPAPSGPVPEPELVGGVPVVGRVEDDVLPRGQALLPAHTRLV